MACECPPGTPALGKRRGRHMVCARCKRLRSATAVGFVITPDEIKDRVNSLDAAISVLDGDVRAYTGAGLSKGWRTEWDAFVRRWTLERDGYASWSSRLFATRAMPRIESYQDNYKFWARDFQRKTGQRPPTATPAPQETMSAALVPDMVWLLAAGVAALWVLSRK